MTVVAKDISTREGGNSLISSASTFIDDNIRAFRNSLYIIGGVGVLLIGRSLYISRVFHCVEDIPAHFIRKHVRLRGKVRHLADDGVLQVEHIPALRLRIPYTPVRPVTPLPVHLACIEMTPAGLRWMQDNVIDKKVWIRPLVRLEGKEHSQLYSQVEITRRFRNLQLNEKLIEQGLCKVGPLTPIEDTSQLQLSTNKGLADYINSLVALEAKAAKKQTGVWKGYKSTVESPWRRRGVRIVKNVITSPVWAFKWLYQKWKR